MPSEKIWDFWADKYERLWVQKYSLQPTRKLIIAEIKSRLLQMGNGNIKLLDIGCGTGQLIQDIQNQLSAQGITCRGIDQSPEMIKQASAKMIPNSSFSISDAQDLHLGEQFDIITCCHSLPYYQDKQKALQEFRRVLKPGGVLFLIQAAANNFYDRLILKLVKLTTSPGDYPSDEDIYGLVKEAKMNIYEQKRLAAFPLVPSITLSIINMER